MRRRAEASGVPAGRRTDGRPARRARADAGTTRATRPARTAPADGDHFRNGDLPAPRCSKQDVEAPLIAKRVIAKPGQVPIAFTLDYDPTLIETGHAYAISARITDRGQLQFVTDTRVGVLGGAATGTPLEIVVVPVR